MVDSKKYNGSTWEHSLHKLTMSGWHDAIVQEKSRNLFDRTGEQVGYYIDSSGNLVGGTSAAGWTTSDYIKIEGNTQYTFNPNTTAGNSAKHCLYNANKQPLISYIMPSGQRTFTTPQGGVYARFSYRDASSNIMLNEGSTALPYEPYWK